MLEALAVTQDRCDEAGKGKMGTKSHGPPNTTREDEERTFSRKEKKGDDVNTPFETHLENLAN